MKVFKKYIRTKDGKIFDVSEICVPYQVIDSWIDFNSQGRFEILNQADTIEELCDSYVVIDKGNYKTLVDNCQLAYDYLRGIEGWCKTKEVFGAIWTDKGLQFVARMNSKGELELL